MIASGLVQYHEDLAALLMPIDDIHQHPDNPNNGDVDEIAASIETNGMYQPVTVQKSTGYILRGNHTWLACKSLDATEIPVVMLDVDDMHALRILMGDNRIAQLAMMDPALELRALERIAADDSLYGTGYGLADLERLRKMATTPLVPDGPEAAENWPVICVQVHPSVKRAYRDLTSAAGGETERFLLLLRLAGADLD